jgi:hypothetical protein
LSRGDGDDVHDVSNAKAQIMEQKVIPLITGNIRFNDAEVDKKGMLIELREVVQGEVADRRPGTVGRRQAGRVGVRHAEKQEKQTRNTVTLTIADR